MTRLVYLLACFYSKLRFAWDKGMRDGHDKGVDALRFRAVKVTKRPPLYFTD